MITISSKYHLLNFETRKVLHENQLVKPFAFSLPQNVPKNTHQRKRGQLSNLNLKRKVQILI